jgi:ubiquinone/menaquinone biosynthesis C-methylase UbiE
MGQTRRKTGYGDFSNNAVDYFSCRRGFPEMVLDFIFQKLGENHPVILDVGCGTGIASRQLEARGGRVYGSDVSPEMISLARKLGDGVEYFVAEAESQPFPAATFDCVTVFSAFHWFSKISVLREFQRVLKPDGLLFIVNKNDTGQFKAVFRWSIQQALRSPIPSVKSKYDPAGLVREAGFVDIQVADCRGSEAFSNAEARAYFRSTSLWNLIPQAQENEVLTIANTEIDRLLSSNKTVEREFRCSIVCGKNDAWILN